MGQGKPPQQEPMMTLLWEAVHRFAAKSGLRLAPSTNPGTLETHRWKAPHMAPPEDILVL